MEFVELKMKTKDQLVELDQSLRKDLFNLRFQKASGELAKSSEYKAKRRIIARVQTALTNLNKKKEAK